MESLTRFSYAMEPHIRDAFRSFGVSDIKPRHEGDSFVFQFRNRLYKLNFFYDEQKVPYFSMSVSCPEAECNGLIQYIKNVVSSTALDRTKYASRAKIDKTEGAIEIKCRVKRIPEVERDAIRNFCGDFWVNLISPAIKNIIEVDLDIKKGERV